MTLQEHEGQYHDEGPQYDSFGPLHDYRLARRVEHGERSLC